MKATVITDASFCPETNAAGWAAWVTYSKGTERERIKKFGTFKRKPKDSGQAELWAALNGVALAAKAGALDILLQTDCMQVVNLLKENQDKIQQSLALAKIYTNPKVSTFHVKGRTQFKGARFWVNRWCDAQAGAEMRRQRKSLCFTQT